MVKRHSNDRAIWQASWLLYIFWITVIAASIVILVTGL